MLNIYKVCVENLNMSLHDLDETNLETLIDYLFFKPKVTNVKVIDGKTYKRANSSKPPAWL